MAPLILLVRLLCLARGPYAYIRLMKRMSTVATSARAAPSVGLSSPVTSSPLNRPSTTAQDMASLAKSETSPASGKSISARADTSMPRWSA